MATSKALLAQAVSDFEALYQAYTRAGVFADDAPPAVAQQLLGNGEDIYRFTRAFLLADALLRHRVGTLVYGGSSLRHLAVFGGNNVGKSTIVNILAAEHVASTSVEGGHTRHALACVAATLTEPILPLTGANPYALARCTPGPADTGARTHVPYDKVVRRITNVLPQDVVLWDMPDCDATESRQYLSTVIDVVTWADVVIYVTSVERYAVAHLIEWVFLLHEAGITLLECLNKTRRSDQAAVIEHQRTTHFPAMAQQLRTAAPTLPIVGLRYLSEGEEADLWGPHHPEAVQLRDTAVARLSQVQRPLAGTAALTFVMQSLDRLLDPARMEILAQEQWTLAVEAALDHFVTVYAQAYLPSSQVIEPFSRLNLEILHLLDPDIPGLLQALQVVRWVTRWPARLVLTVGRRMLRVILNHGDEQAKQLPAEGQAYADAHTAVLTTLGALIDTACQAPRHHPFWEALRTAWTETLTTLSVRFGEQLQRHMQETDQAIKQAAAEIYARLQHRPLLLHTLRGVRVTANVSGALVGFLLPMKGGIIHDLLEELVLAPVLMTGVEAATTSAVESFVSARRKQLVAQLHSEAKTMATHLYRAPLLQLAETAIQQAGTLGIGKDLLVRLPATLAQLHAHVASPPSLLT